MSVWKWDAKRQCSKEYFFFFKEFKILLKYFLYNLFKILIAYFFNQCIWVIGIQIHYKSIRDTFKIGILKQNHLAIGITNNLYFIHISSIYPMKKN